MTEYNTLNVTLSNWQLKKLKSAIKWSRSNFKALIELYWNF